LLPVRCEAASERAGFELYFELTDTTAAFTAWMRVCALTVFELLSCPQQPAGVNALFTAGRALSFAFAGMRAAQRNHTALLAAVLAAPLSYLESLPSGRLLNRCAACGWMDGWHSFMARHVNSDLFDLGCTDSVY
jgi:hypothetical protein